jgi:hypothetical protein
MPELNDQVALPLFLVLGAFFIGWFVVGNELMRRRAARLARWCKRATDPLGGKRGVRWLTLHSFRLEVEDARAPFRSGSLTGLTESWDVPMIWLWNRRRGRRDLVLVQMGLRQPPRWGLELYRPLSPLAGDARHLARREGWEEAPLDELRVASPGPAAEALARRLLAELGPERARLVRLALRRQGTHLTLALDLPDPDRFAPEALPRLLERLAGVAAGAAAPSEPGA